VDQKPRVWKRYCPVDRRLDHLPAHGRVSASPGLVLALATSSSPAIIATG